MSFNRKNVVVALTAAATAAVGLGAQSAHAATKEPSGIKPDINRSNCLLGDPLRVVQSDGNNEDCFENAGAIDVKIGNFDSVYTGNNGTQFTLEHASGYYVCTESWKDTWFSAEECGAPWNVATMTWLKIMPAR